MICSLAIARIVNSQFKSFYLTSHLSHLAVHIRQAVEDRAGAHKAFALIAGAPNRVAGSFTSLITPHCAPNTTWSATWICPDNPAWPPNMQWLPIFTEPAMPTWLP